METIRKLPGNKLKVFNFKCFPIYHSYQLSYLITYNRIQFQKYAIEINRQQLKILHGAKKHLRKIINVKIWKTRIRVDPSPCVKSLRNLGSDLHR
jgi:hypothetical protein